MFNRQKLFETHTKTPVSPDNIASEEIWDGGFLRNICAMQSDTNTHTRSQSLSVTQTKRTQHFPYSIICTRIYSSHVVCCLLIRSHWHSVVSAEQLFFFSFHWYKGISWRVWDRVKKMESVSCATNSATDPKKRETIKYEKVTLSLFVN